MGEAFDAEDGTLPNEQLRWWLNNDQGATLLGTGAMLSAGPFAAGDYVISLDVQDSDGKWGSAVRTIHVGEQPGNVVYLPVVLKRR